MPIDFAMLRQLWHDIMLRAKCGETEENCEGTYGCRAWLEAIVEIDVVKSMRGQSSLGDAL